VAALSVQPDLLAKAMPVLFHLDTAVIVAG